MERVTACEKIRTRREQDRGGRHRTLRPWPGGSAPRSSPTGRDTTHDDLVRAMIVEERAVGRQAVVTAAGTGDRAHLIVDYHMCNAELPRGYGAGGATQLTATDDDAPPCGSKYTRRVVGVEAVGGITWVRTPPASISSISKPSGELRSDLARSVPRHHLVGERDHRPPTLGVVERRGGGRRQRARREQAAAPGRSPWSAPSRPGAVPGEPSRPALRS